MTPADPAGGGRFGWGAALVALLSHWRRHPGQLAAVLTGLALAAALWSGVQALNQQARASYDQAAATLGGDLVESVSTRDGGRFDQSVYIALRLAGWRVSPVLEGRIRLAPAPGREGLGPVVTLIGVDPATAPAEAGLFAPTDEAPADTEGGPAEDLDAAEDENPFIAFVTPPYRALLAPETAAAIGAPLGARPTLADQPARALPPLALQPGLAPGVIVVDVGVAQRMLGAPGALTRLLIDPSPAPPPLAPLEEIAGPRFERVAPSTEAEAGRLADSFHLNLTAFGLLSFLVGLFIVHAAVGLAFEQRRPSLRTLRSCGVSARALTALMLAETIAFALIAGAIGMALGYVLAGALLPNVAATLSGLYGAQVAGALSLQPSWWAAGLGMTLLGALAAAGASLWRAYGLPVLATARPDAWRVAHARSVRLQAALGLACLIGAGLLLIFGRTLTAGFAMIGALLLGAALMLPLILDAFLRFGAGLAKAPLALWAWADARQQLSALSLALMALLLALSANIGVGTMVESFRATFLDWLDRRLAAEVYYRGDDDAQAAEIADWLRARPDVSAVLSSWRDETRIRDWPTEVYALPEHATYREGWPLRAASPDAWDRLAQGEGALVSEQLARRFDFAIGDRLEVPAPAGPLRTVIVGVYPDYGNPKGQIAISPDALLTHWPDAPRTSYAVRADPQAAPALAAELRDRFTLGPTQVIDQIALKRFSATVFERTFAVTAALNALTLAVAGVALLASLLTVSGLRATQLAPVWAVGVDRGRLAGLELIKTLALAAATAVAAIPLGLALAWCLVAVINVQAFGWRLPLYLFPTQWAALAAVAVATALAASLLPVWRLRRISPARLLQAFAQDR